MDTLNTLIKALGGMSMPAAFRYRDVFLKGKPEHDRYDPFRIRHPQMPCGRRAKIFAPFDALKGFSEAISAQNDLYEEQQISSSGDQEEIESSEDIFDRDWEDQSCGWDL